MLFGTHLGAVLGRYGGPKMESNIVKIATWRPNKAVQKDMKGYFVYKTEVSEKGDVVIKQYVKTGPSNNLSMLIEKGVLSGEKIVVDGYNQVSDGSYVEVVQ